jgi:hypothetical protein
MQRSSKLGIAGLTLALLCLILAPLRFPFAFISGFLSCVVGLLAGFQGNRWWLAIPGTIILTTLLLFLLLARIP